MEERLYSTKELAEIFGVSQSSIKRCISKQTIKPIANSLFSIKQFTEYGFVTKQNVCNSNEADIGKVNQDNEQGIHQQISYLQENKNLNDVRQNDKIDRKRKLNYEELKEEAKSYLPNLLAELGVDNLSKNFRCLCPDHNDSTPSMSYYSDTQKVHCHGCGFHGDIFDVYSLVTNKHIDKTLFDEVYEKYGLIEYTPKTNKLKVSAKPKIAPAKPPAESKKELIDRSEEIAQAKANIEQTDYWKRRGFTLDTVKHFNCGFIKGWRHPDFNTPPSDRLILPTGDGIHSYLARDVHSDGDYKVLKVGGKVLFNLDGFNDEFVFVAEGEFDAMSIWQTGFTSVVGLGGIGNKDKFVETISAMETKPKAVVIALDNDEQGIKAANWIYEELKKIGVFSKIYNNYFGEYKDANGLLQHDSESLRKYIQKALADTLAGYTSRIEAISVDCPLPVEKLVMPNGLNVDFDNHVTLNEGGQSVKFNSIMLISKRFKNIDTNVEKVEISVLKAFAQDWKRFVTERRNIASKNRIVDLASFGLDVNSTRSSSLVNYFDAFEVANSKIIPNAYTVSSTGWRANDEFVYPNTEGCPYEIDDTIKPQLDKVFQSNGNKKPVIELLKKHIDKTAVFAVVGGCLAAPLVKILRCPNIALHIYANTGSGKSTLNKLGISLFADPNVAAALPTADATRVGIEYYLAGRHDLPAVIEDISSVNDEKSRKNVEMLPYQFTGAGRLRGSKTGGNAPLLDFRGTLITNGEKPLTTDTSSGGGKRRLMEIKADDKIFTMQEAREIYAVIEDNYGLFGRDWIDYIKTSQKGIKKDYEVFTRGTTKSDGKKIASFFEKFESKIPLHINSIAAITVATAHFCKKFLGMTENEALTLSVRAAFKILRSLPDEIAIADYIRAKAIIIDWFLLNKKKFVDDSEYSSESPQYNDTKSFEEYGIIKKNLIAINTTKLKQLLEDNDLSPNMIISQLAEDGFIIRDGKHYDKLVWVKELKKQVRMTCIDITKIGEEDLEDIVPLK